MDKINWFPGHMKKTGDLIRENLKLVDLVLELVDARIPIASKNPDIDKLTQGKKRLIVLNKIDLADEQVNKDWADYFNRQGFDVVMINANTGTGLNNLMKTLERYQAEKNQEKANLKSLRIMVVGVPNVGKSSLINRLMGRKSAMIGDRPGVTRGKQWLKMNNSMEILDTPGILWPKFEDPDVGLKLAFCGSIKDEIMDLETLALRLIEKLSDEYPEALVKRYDIEEISEDPLDTMENIARKRGFILSRGRIDYERTARTVLYEFRGGLLGKISLERPDLWDERI